MKNKIIFSCISLFLVPFIINARQTGSFTALFNISGTNTNVAFYVPSDYKAANFYPLVVAMHPGSSEGTSMRSLMIPAATGLNVILACPDHTGSNKGTIASGIIGIAPAVWNYGSYNYPITNNSPVDIIVGSEDDFITETREIKLNIEKQVVRHMDPYFQSADFTTDWISCYNFIKDTINSVAPENQAELEIRLLKNPVNEYLEIEFSVPGTFESDLKIFSLNGQLMYDKRFKLFNEQNNIIILPINTLRPGVYILKAHVNGSSNTITFNVIK